MVNSAYQVHSKSVVFDSDAANLLVCTIYGCPFVDNPHLLNVAMRHAGTVKNWSVAKRTCGGVDCFVTGGCSIF